MGLKLLSELLLIPEHNTSGILPVQHFLLLADLFCSGRRLRATWLDGLVILEVQPSSAGGKCPTRSNSSSAPFGQPFLQPTFSSQPFLGYLEILPCGCNTALILRQLFLESLFIADPLCPHYLSSQQPPCFLQTLSSRPPTRVHLAPCGTFSLQVFLALCGLWHSFLSNCSLSILFMKARCSAYHLIPLVQPPQVGM